VLSTGRRRKVYNFSSFFSFVDLDSLLNKNAAYPIKII